MTRPSAKNKPKNGVVSFWVDCDVDIDSPALQDMLSEKELVRDKMKKSNPACPAPTTPQPQQEVDIEKLFGEI